jgi:hypothetical protein
MILISARSKNSLYLIAIDRLATLCLRKALGDRRSQVLPRFFR